RLALVEPSGQFDGTVFSCASATGKCRFVATILNRRRRACRVRGLRRSRASRHARRRENSAATQTAQRSYAADVDVVPTTYASQLTLASAARERLVFAVVERDAFALRQNVGFERAQFWIVGIERLALDWILDTPVDHVAQQRDLLQLYLVFRISLGMRIRRVGMAHVAAHANCAAERRAVVEEIFPFCDEVVGLVLPDFVVALGEAGVGVALLHSLGCRLRSRCRCCI